MPLLLVASLALVLAACGAQHRTDATIPVRSADVRATLEGAWTIYDDGGERSGTVAFDGGRFVAESATNRFFGAWDLLTPTPNAHTLVLTVDGVEAQGIRELYGSPDEVRLQLVFASWTRAFVFEQGAAWTEWQRTVEGSGDAP